MKVVLFSILLAWMNLGCERVTLPWNVRSLSMVGGALMSSPNVVSAKKIHLRAQDFANRSIRIGETVREVGKFVAPMPSKKMRYIQQVNMEKSPASEVAKGPNWSSERSKLYHYQSYAPEDNVLNGVEITQTGLAWAPNFSIFAIASLQTLRAVWSRIQ